MIIVSDFFAAGSPLVGALDVKLSSNSIFVEIIGDSDVIGAWRVRSALNVSEHFFIVGDVESCSAESMAFVLSKKNF